MLVIFLENQSLLFLYKVFLLLRNTISLYINIARIRLIKQPINDFYKILIRS